MLRAHLLLLPLLALAAGVPGHAREARLRLPEGFDARAAPQAVSGLSPRRHGEPVRFGPYSALEMREGGRVGRDIPLGRSALRSLDQGWAYTEIALGQPPVQAQCRARSRAYVRGDAGAEFSVDLAALQGSPVLACGFRADGEHVLLFQLHRRGDRLDGDADGPGGAYRIRSLHGLEGTPLRSGDPAGYEILKQERPVAVVDRLNAGSVAMDPALDAEEQVRLAALATALLLFDPAFGDG